MKHAFYSAFFCLFLVGKITAQGLVFQDTVFTDPVIVSDQIEFVTFQNCRFVNINGAALTLNKTGAIISDCTFEAITGTAIVLDSSEIYLVSDTLQNITGKGLDATYSTVVVQGSLFSQITEGALTFQSCELAEISDCDIADAGQGISTSDGENGQLSVLNTKIRRLNGDPGLLYAGSAIIVDRVSLVEIEDNVIDSCLAYGIYLNGYALDTLVAEASIQGNTISRTNRGGLYGIFAQNTTIRGNEISYTGFLGAGGGCIRWSGANARIEGNHLHHALRVDGNPIYDYFGILIGSSATITRNLIHDCTNNGIQYATLSANPGASLLLFNNVIYQVGGHPIYYIGNSLEPAQTVIRNNTMQAIPSGNPASDAPLAVIANVHPVSAQGNILIYDGIADTSLYVKSDAGSAFTENLNLKVAGDIGFVNYAGRDFHLASATSPAYNFLPLNFGLPNDDFDSHPRTGLHDAGAFELSLADTICGCTNCPQTIPDLFFGDFIYSVGSIANSDLAAPNQGVCGVRIQFEHEYLSDLSMELISPSGQTIQLVGPAGFFGATDFTNWDIGFTGCNANASPDPGFQAQWNNEQPWGIGGVYTGIYHPSNGCLEDFNSGTVIGDWTLRVYDNQVLDTGVVQRFEMMFCDMTGITCQPCSNPPHAQFSTASVSPWAINIQNQTTGGTVELQIDFGDGITALGHVIPPIHTYADTGTFFIQLIAINDCGVDTFVQAVHIQGALPVAFVTAQPTKGCAPLQVQLGSTFSDNVAQWHWFCPGGTPSESFLAEPLITYTTPGAYLISVVASNSIGSDTLLDVITVEVFEGLGNISFSTEVMGDSIICTNTTQNAESFFWTINNGDPVGVNTSPQVFVVDTSGNYTITLTAASNCDFDEISNTVPVLLSGTNLLEKSGWQFVLSPNPNEGAFNLNIVSPEPASGQLTVLNALGEQLYAENIQTTVGKNTFPVQLAQLPSGLYHLHFSTDSGEVVLRFVVR